MAIADIQGNMRSSQKSKFLDTLTQCLHFDRAVTDVCPLLSHPPQDLCVIIDMLYYVHMPPPPNVTTFNEFFTHLWNQTVGKFVFQHRAAHVIIVLDKPDFLPPPRSIVHTTRARSAQDTKVDPTVAADEHIPHSRTYSSLLSASQTFKSNLLEFITTQIIDKAVTVSRQFNFSLTMDSPSLSVVQTIHNGNTHDSPNNEHGEADYAVWHHCIHASSNNVLIVSSDTDTWVYGLGLCELNFFQGKHVYIQRGNTNSYININEGTSLISQHPKLSPMTYPVLSLVALYILTGCDYLSSFYMCTKTKFLESLIQNLSFICPNGNGLLKMIGSEFQYINEDAWVRLVSAVYYTKHKAFFRSKPITHTYDIIHNHPDSPESQRMLSALNFTPSSRSQLSTWHEFIRRVTYHMPKVTKTHEFKVLPSYRALLHHCKRATYIVKLILSSSLRQSPFLLCYEQFGWHTKDGNVEITWDSGNPSYAEEASDSENDLDSAGETDDEQPGSSDSEPEIMPIVASDGLSEDDYET